MAELVDGSEVRAVSWLDSMTVGDFQRLSDSILGSLTEQVRRELRVPNLDRFEERRRSGELRWLRADGTRPA